MKKFSVAFFLILVLAAGLFVYRALLPLPVEAPGNELIVIQKGMTARDVGAILIEPGLIRNVREFSLLSKYFELDRKLKAGRYCIPRGAALVEIIKQLAKGSPEYDVVVIPEGLTIEEIAARLFRECGIDSAEFVRLSHNPAQIGELGIAASSLEGYLFPDTYQFAWGSKTLPVIVTMVSRYKDIYRELAKDPDTKNMTEHKIVTLASIIEKESGVDEERPHIAGVFLNRLRIGMPLGADPTVRFALKKLTGPLTVSDLQNASPYNTRRFGGLPPGPICSPGYKSIKAAFFPLETKDLYFVAKDDGSHEHYFSKTLDEHARAKQKARKEKRIQENVP